MGGLLSWLSCGVVVVEMIRVVVRVCKSSSTGQILSDHGVQQEQEPVIALCTCKVVHVICTSGMKESGS